MPLDRKSPKTCEKMQIPSPDQRPEKKGKMTEEVRKLQVWSNFRTFSVIFPYFRGVPQLFKAPDTYV